MAIIAGLSKDYKNNWRDKNKLGYSRLGLMVLLAMIASQTMGEGVAWSFLRTSQVFYQRNKIFPMA